MIKELGSWKLIIMQAVLAIDDIHMVLATLYVCVMSPAVYLYEAIDVQFHS